MKEQSFLEYSRQKREDLTALQYFFPEYFVGDATYFDKEYVVKTQMEEVKVKFEQIFGRKIHWRDVDHYSTFFMGIACEHMKKKLESGELSPIKTFDDLLSFDYKVREEFCNMLKVKMIDEESYKELCKINRCIAQNIIQP